MKKLLSFIAILSVFSLNASVLHLSGEGSNLIPSRNVEYVSDGVIVTYAFENIEYQQDDLYPNSYTFSIPGFGFNYSVTEPMYLYHKDVFAIPAGKAANLTLLGSQYNDYQMRMSPSRPILENINDTPFTTDNVPPVSAYSGYLPVNIVVNENTSKYRGVNLAEIGVQPIQYNYSTQTTRIYYSITYKVTFQDDLSDLQPEESGTTPNKFLRRLIVNPENFEDTLTNGGRAAVVSSPEKIRTDYLIISANRYAEEIERFAKWKRHLGFNTHVLLKDNWTFEEMRDSVRQKYYAFTDSIGNSTLDYLLLIGNISEVPTTLIEYPYGGYNYIGATDINLVTIHTNNSLIPDIHLGRIPVNTVEELTNVFDKIIYYEKTPIIDDDFYNNATHCAYFQIDQSSSFVKEDRAFVLSSEQVRNHMIGVGKNITRIYQADTSADPLFLNNGDSIDSQIQKPNYDWNGSAADIQNAINSGAFYILHRDHGEERGWSTPCFYNNHLNGLNNENKYPVVFSINCNSGSFHSPICFCKNFLTKKDAGAVALIGASKISWTETNNILVNGMFDAIWPNGYLNTVFQYENNINFYKKPVYRLGQILSQGLFRVYSEIKKGNVATPYIVYDTIKMYNIFGDPSMQIYTETPTTFENVRISRGVSSISVSLQESATITFYNEDTEEVTCYEGTSVRYSGNDVNKIIVCISGHNKVPYINDRSKPILTPPDNGIYNPSFYDNKIYVTYNHKVDYSNAKMTLTNSENPSRTRTLDIIQEDPLSGYVTAPAGTMEQIAGDGCNLINVAVRNVMPGDTTVLSVNPLDALIKYRSNSTMPTWTVNPASNSQLDSLTSNIKFRFSQPVNCKEVEIVSGPLNERNQNFKVLNQNTCDSLSFGLMANYWTLTQQIPTMKITLSKVLDDEGFTYPYGLFTADYMVIYDSDATLLTITPPTSAKYQTLYANHTLINFKFSDRVVFSDDLVATFTFNGCGDDAGDTRVYNIYSDQISLKRTGSGLFEINLIPQYLPANFSWDTVDIALCGLTRGETPFETPISVTYRSIINPAHRSETGIAEVYSESQPEIIYDLAGRKLKSLESAQKGIYIVNGKKVMK